MLVLHPWQIAVAGSSHSHVEIEIKAAAFDMIMKPNRMNHNAQQLQAPGKRTCPRIKTQVALERLRLHPESANSCIWYPTDEVMVRR